jgi:hypothetical protein
MNVKVLLAVLATACSHAFALDNATNERAVIIMKYTGISARDKNTYTFVPGEIVAIHNTDGNKVLVESEYRDWLTVGGVWLPKDVVVIKKSFTRIDKWMGEKRIEFESPDLGVVYTLNSYGAVTFRVYDTSASGRLKGHLYRSNNVLWVRTQKVDGILEQNIFVILPNGKLCSPNPPEICIAP